MDHTDWSGRHTSRMRTSSRHRAPILYLTQKVTLITWCSTGSCAALARAWGETGYDMHSGWGIEEDRGTYATACAFDQSNHYAKFSNQTFPGCPPALFDPDQELLPTGYDQWVLGRHERPQLQRVEERAVQ